MKSLIQLEDINLSFNQDLWRSILSLIPKLFLGIGFLILAYISIKVVTYILKRLLKVTRVDSITTKLNEAKLFGKSDYDVVPSEIILKFVKYLLILVFVVVASELMGLNMVSEGIGSFIAYLPILITALLIFVVGVYFASIIKKSILDTFKSMELSGSNLVSNIAFYVIVVFVSITALNQAGVDTAIITSNLTIILGSVLLSFAIAFGLGAKEIIARLLFGFYSRKNFEVGQHIKLNKVEGTIQEIDNIYITIKTAEGTIVMPIKQFVNQKVLIK